MQGRVLIVAGSDSGGGAGIQADIKTVMALGGYATTALTALTAQDTCGVHEVRPVDPAFVALQMELVLADIGADAIKTGMLGSSATIDAVAEVLARKAPGVPLVVDPVMIAKGGRPLLDGAAIATLKERLIPRAALVTPNLPEAEALLGRGAIQSVEAMKESARAMLTLGCKAALIKGGHLACLREAEAASLPPSRSPLRQAKEGRRRQDGPTVVDVLATAEGIETFEYPRIASKHTHGTGCTLASASAVGLAQGLALRDAVARARAYVQEAIRTAPGLGHGHGPLNHAHTVRPFRVP